MKISFQYYSGLLLFINASFAFPQTSAVLHEVARSDIRWTGVAVSEEGRIFVNYPRWGLVPFSVAEIVNGKVQPYPSAGWNLWNDSISVKNHFVCVQSVYIDKHNFLWALDAGASLKTGVIRDAPKLIKIDLTKDSVIHIHRFDESITPKDAYLNDIRVDTKRNFAYLTESGAGAIVVTDLTTGTSRRLLDHHYSVKAEPMQLTINGNAVDFPVHADGLALTGDGEYLYYKALTGRALYRIKTGILRNETADTAALNQAVEFVQSTLPCDAIEFDSAGNLYFTSIEDNAIWRLNSENHFEKIITDPRLTWPDSFSITPSGIIFVTTSGILFPKSVHYIFKIVI